jgi:hypothetical protein
MKLPFFFMNDATNVPFVLDLVGDATAGCTNFSFLGDRLMRAYLVIP